MPTVDKDSIPETISTAELMKLHERSRVGSLAERVFTDRELWDALGPLLDGSELRREEIGRSVEGRPLYSVSHGTGPTRVLLWSQMHGDESTATMALADIIRLLSEEPDHWLVRRLAEHLTIVAIPMLNPDGAERFQRHNVYGVDINRDARRLATPEARALKEVHASVRPDFGFNLHDQDVRRRVGRSNRPAAIALLAPPPNASGEDTDGVRRAKKVAAVVRSAVEPMVEGHMTRFDDTYNPRAFGDRMQSWGTSTVLIEAGGWRGDPEKQYLRKATFVAILSALDAIATGAYAEADPAGYASLPCNGEAASDLLVRGGTLVLPGLDPLRADITIDFEDPLARRGGRITEVGDLADVSTHDTLRVDNLFIHLHGASRSHDDPSASLPIGAPGTFTVRRGPEATSEVLWRVEDGRVETARAGEVSEGRTL